MNSLQLETGGRPVANDDFQVLQDRDAVLGLPALLTGLGPCVVSGCRVFQTGSQYNVGAGMVWDGTQLLPFSGRSNVALPAMFEAGAVVVVDERAYQTGGTKTTIKAQSMDLVPVVAGAPNLVVDTWGCLRWNDVVRASVRYIGEIMPLATTGYIATDYDTDGLGLSGTSAWGWHICNGLGDTDDLSGRVLLQLDPSKSVYDTVGKQGGEEEHKLLLSELPRHDHGGGAFSNENSYITYSSGRSGANAAQWGGRGTVQPQGGGQPHSNMQPFSTVLMRQWVGYSI